MKEFGMPTHFPINGHNVAFSELNKKFAVTHYGEKLRSNIRYGPFKPSELSNAQWEKILGADVNNFNHLNLTLGLAKSFLSGCEKPQKKWEGKVPEKAIFTVKEKEALLLTAAVHDWGEAVIGDIPFPDKKKSDEELEMIYLRQIVHEVVGEGRYQKECDKLADTVESVLTGKDGKLSKAFSAIERVGYARTGFRAWNSSRTHSGKVKESLEHMGLQVVTDHLPTIVAHGEHYPPVDSFVKHHESIITKLITEGSGRGVINKRSQFIEAKSIWEKRPQVS